MSLGDSNAFSTKALNGKRILVVDDEPTVREVVAAYLDRDGFSVTQAIDGEEALRLIKTGKPDLVLLDVMIPGYDGLSVLRTIRSSLTTPVILLTARADESDRILGLELGADDYVVKPFSPREIVARVRAVLKRSAANDQVDDRILFDGMTIDGASREVHVGDARVDLTPREFDLLFFLASSPRQVFSRRQLLEHVWDSSSEWQDPATVTVHVGRLRRKIESDESDPRWITTVWGVGYRFEP